MKTVKLKVHQCKPIPDRVWRINYGWWISITKDDGTRVVRTGLSSREECIAQGREAAESPNVVSVWFGQMDKVPDRRA